MRWNPPYPIELFEMLMREDPDPQSGSFCRMAITILETLPDRLRTFRAAAAGSVRVEGGETPSRATMAHFPTDLGVERCLAIVEHLLSWYLHGRIRTCWCALGVVSGDQEIDLYRSWLFRMLSAFLIRWREAAPDSQPDVHWYISQGELNSLLEIQRSLERALGYATNHPLLRKKQPAAQPQTQATAVAPPTKVDPMVALPKPDRVTCTTQTELAEAEGKSSTRAHYLDALHKEGRIRIIEGARKRGGKSKVEVLDALLWDALVKLREGRH